MIVLNYYARILYVFEYFMKSYPLLMHFGF